MAKEIQWYYVLDGQRKGPVSESEIEVLFSQDTLDGDTQVWTKGMERWGALRSTQLGAYVNLAPPVLAHEHINNRYVWVVAFLPLVFTLIDLGARAYFTNLITDNPQLLLQPEQLKNYTDAYNFWSSIVVVGLNVLFCSLDTFYVDRAGFQTSRLGFFSKLLVPVYLFMRASVTKQAPSYGWVWIVMFGIQLFLASR